MKLKNNMNDVRSLRDNGKVIEVGPGKTVDVVNPNYNPNVFTVVDIQKSKEKKLEVKSQGEELKEDE